MNKENIDVIVIGGGAAGMMAAGMAAKGGCRTVLVEKNKILGKKLLITGKGRCNLTNACEDVETLIANVPTNASFLYSAFYTFTNHDVIAFFNSLGVATKVERGNRVFPVSDQSKDIASALTRFVRQEGVKILADQADEVLAENGRVSGVRLTKGGILNAPRVIIATGGMSYYRTGSTGDGYSWAENLGHTIVEPIPSLVPLETETQWVKDLAGLSLKNVAIAVKNSRGKTIYEDFGELMFAHFGLTGPVILSASAHMRQMGQEQYTVEIDLKPALDNKQLHARVLRDFQKYCNKAFVNSLSDLLPHRLIDVIVYLSGIEPYKQVNGITKEERARLIEVIKCLRVPISNFCPIEQAVITSGGVSVREINPSDMQSKIVPGLYFAGEIIDVDAYTGGFNLQIAFSTGYLAGQSCAKSVQMGV